MLDGTDFAQSTDVEEAMRVASNIAMVRQRILMASQRAGRSPDAVTLIAVTKTQPVHKIVAAYQAGIRHFGENYVQEMRGKLGRPPLNWQDAQWHFIGHLQRNKARAIFLGQPSAESTSQDAVSGRNDARFALIQSVDSVDTLPLAQELGRRAHQQGKVLPILLEVKLDPGPTKFGFEPDRLQDEVAQIQDIAGIALHGLMGMAPFAKDAEQARPYFRQLYTLFRALPTTCQRDLSMGMTGDFEVAIEEGATQVRIGTALFGPRLSI